MMRRLLFAAFACSGLVAIPARAQLAAGIDANGTVDARGDGLGGGVEARLGYRTALTRAWMLHFLIVQPEVVGGYMALPLPAPSTETAQVGFVGGGLRLGFLLGRFEPFGYFHAGGLRKDNFDGFMELGGALDVRFPSWSLGLHASHDWCTPRSGLVPWYMFGPHFEYRWFWF